MRITKIELGIILAIVGIILGIVSGSVADMQRRKDNCRALHALYGSGRCVFERYGEPKIVLPDGTPRYLPGDVEAR